MATKEERFQEQLKAEGIFMAADGRYTAFITVGTKADGTRERKKIARKDPEVALRLVKDAKHALSKGSVLPTQTTVASVLETWLDGRRKVSAKR